MIRRLSLITGVLAAGLLVPGGACAFTLETVPGLAQRPTIASVTPSRIAVGNLLVVRGSGFVPGSHRNVVFFSRPGVRPVFASADAATDHTVIVRITQRLLPYLALREGAAGYTRFRLRVLSDRLGPYWTPYRKSPLIGPSTLTQAVKPVLPPAISNGDGPGARARAAVAAFTAAALPALPALPSACSLKQALKTADASPSDAASALAGCNA